MIGIVCQELEKTWKNIRLFAFNNRTIFEILFILLYALLQIALIFFVEVYPIKITFILSVFAILVLSLFALHKLLMESRIRLLENRVAEMTLGKEALLSIIREIYESYSKIHTEARSESKSIYNKREDKIL